MALILYGTVPVMFDIGSINNSLDIAEFWPYPYKCNLVIHNRFEIINIHVC